MTKRDLPPASWALASVLENWKREVGPAVRKAYRQASSDEVDRDAVASAADRVEGMARTLRAAADPKVTRAAE